MTFHVSRLTDIMWILLLFTCAVATAADNKDLDRRSEAIDNKVCSKPFPSEELILQLQMCDPMTRIAVSLL